MNRTYITAVRIQPRAARRLSACGSRCLHQVPALVRAPHLG
ncbi:hypothetical protein [Flexibacterium corallicola]|nr:hypothetical protein [Pseudovibrio sp. M1P-2-3]